MHAKQVFEILMRDNSQMLLTYLRAVVTKQHLVDEIFQETMLTAWQKLADFDKSRPLGPWLRGIAKKHLLAHYRKSKREVLISNEDALGFLEQKIYLIDQQAGDCWDDKIAPLRYCLSLLPDKYRQVIEARYTQDNKPAVITQHLGLSAEALKKRLQRAKKKLFDCLTKNMVMDT